ncbi:unnamed protein product [Candidula unifasciata]|uniref:Uncharacterized protein n=1 Tax=Candidula unifasciata TaxID=100452 RepID=A0A8S3ZNY6_9EUPU|nr:unnamed protein product [Candidula unifasciata]
MAAKRGSKALGEANQSRSDNEELLKSLGTQLNVHFSKYDQWQRSSRNAKSQVSTGPEAKITFKVGAVPRVRPSRCVSTSAGKTQKSVAKLEDEKRKQKEIIDVLELKIKHCRQTADLYRKRSTELIEMNLDIIRGIESQEQAVYAEVKKLLRKYETFQGSGAALNSLFAQEISEVKQELEQTTEIIQRKIKTLEEAVDKLDRKLRVKQKEVQFLRNYKDKEYPVKELIISKLLMEIDSVKNLNQEDQEDLEHIIETELGKYGRERIRLANNIICKSAEETVALIPPGLEKMALQNVMMKKEIEVHKIEQENLIQENKKLQQEVAELIKHPKSNLRLQLFPEIFPAKEKCDPDTEVVLDIPTQEWISL